MKLSDKAMIVKLNISQWNIRKVDYQATAEVIRKHKARADSGRFNKVLVDLRAAKIYQRIATEARTFHYAQTLPWGDDGSRILPSENYIPYTQKMREYKNKFQQAAQEFISKYPDLIAQAQANLNSLFNPRDYPSPGHLQRTFDFDISVFPLPSGDDFRVNLAQDEIDSIQQDIEARVKDSVAQAVKDIWERLHEAIQHMADKLKDPEAIFRDSLVGNIKELCDLLPRLNITEDRNLDRMISETKSSLAALDPDTLRNSTIDREKATEKAEDILKKMAGYMGV